MRAVAIAAALVASCGSRHDTPPPPSHRAPGAPAAGTLPVDPQQRRFDAERRPDLIVAALKLPQGARVADIGAGTGLFTVHLALAVGPKGAVVATDIDDAVLEMLAQRMASASVANVERRTVPADAPGLEAGTYDAIVLAEVDHYFTDPQDWFGRAKLALRRGGKIAVTNRVHHRTKTMDHALAAGLTVAHESSPTETHFLAVFTAP